MTARLTPREILERLVAFPTVSRDTNMPLIDWVQGYLASHGIEAAKHIKPDEPEKAALFAHVGPKVEGGLVLSGHTDVVPTDGQAWSSDPWVLTERDGKLFGRGSTDMKGFVACAMEAMVAAKSRPLSRPLHIALSYDEEIGCVGVRGLLDVLASGLTGAGTCRPEVVVVGEPTGMRLCNAHAGKVAYRIDLTAASGHSSRAGTEPTAVHEGAALVALVQGLNDPDRGISANVGSIHGGVAVNVLSPSCTLEFEVRHQADTDPDEVLAGVLKAVAEAPADQG